MTTLRHEVVVCTKDRPDELGRCLSSVAEQTCPPSRVVVVDGSTQTSAKTTRDVLMAAQLVVPVDVMHTEPGLTRQRNIALGRLLPDTRVVHFVDDDAILARDYLQRILEEFDTGVAAVGGRIANLPSHRPTRWRCRLLLDSTRQGALLPSGVNVLNFAGDATRSTDWLSGCAMSYSTTAISDLRFDESRTGSGFGEDVDFSARCRDRGRVLWTPFASVIHDQSPHERQSHAQVTRRWVRSRGKLAYDGVVPVRLSAVVLASLAEGAWLAARSVRRRDAATAARAWAEVLGVFDVLTRKPV